MCCEKCCGGVMFDLNSTWFWCYLQFHVLIFGLDVFFFWFHFLAFWIPIFFKFIFSLFFPHVRFFHYEYSYDFLLTLQIRCPRTHLSLTPMNCNLSAPKPHPQQQSALLGPLWWDTQARELGEMAKIEMRDPTGLHLVNVFNVIEHRHTVNGLSRKFLYSSHVALCVWLVRT